MLTNWRTIRQRINELERLERMREKGEFERLTKKEGLIWRHLLPFSSVLHATAATKALLEAAL